MSINDIPEITVYQYITIGLSVLLIIASNLAWWLIIKNSRLKTKLKHFENDVVTGTCELADETIKDYIINRQQELGTVLLVHVNKNKNGVLVNDVFTGFFEGNNIAPTPMNIKIMHAVRNYLMQDPNDLKREMENITTVDDILHILEKEYVDIKMKGE